VILSVSDPVLENEYYVASKPLDIFPMPLCGVEDGLLGSVDRLHFV